MSAASSKEPIKAPPSQAQADVTTLPRKWPYWYGFIILVIIVVGYVAASLFGGIAQAAVYYLLGQPAGFEKTVNGQFTYIFFTYAFFVAVIAYIFKKQGIGPREIGISRPQWADFMWAGLALPVYYISFGLVVSLVTVLVPSFNAEQSQNIGFDGPHSTSQLVIIFLSLAVIPPIVEEIITRGYLYSGLKRTWPKFLAVIGTSLLFALGHLEFGNGGPLVWVAAVFTLVLSFILIGLRELTGRLWAPIMLHALVNGVSFFALFVFNRS